MLLKCAHCGGTICTGQAKRDYITIDDHGEISGINLIKCNQCEKVSMFTFEAKIENYAISKFGKGV